MAFRKRKCHGGGYCRPGGNTQHLRGVRGQRTLRKGLSGGTFKDIGNKTENFFVTREYDNILIGATVPKDILYKNRSSDLLLIGAYLIAIEIVIVVSINVTIKQKSI